MMLSTKEKIEAMRIALGTDNYETPVRMCRKDGSLIERIDKTVLTEDGRELLNG